MTTPTLPSRPGPTRRELEASLEAYFYNQVRLRGGMVEKLISTRRGIPDRLVLLPGGHVFLVELKAWGGRTSAIQEAWHARAAELGTRVVVLEGRDAVDEWLRSWGKNIERTSAAALRRTRAAAAEEMPEATPEELQEAVADLPAADRKAERRRLSAARTRGRRKLAAGKPMTPAEAHALRFFGDL